MPKPLSGLSPVKKFPSGMNLLARNGRFNVGEKPPFHDLVVSGVHAVAP